MHSLNQSHITTHWGFELNSESSLFHLYGCNPFYKGTMFESGRFLKENKKERETTVRQKNLTLYKLLKVRKISYSTTYLSLKPNPNK